MLKQVQLKDPFGSLRGAYRVPCGVWWRNSRGMDEAELMN